MLSLLELAGETVTTTRALMRKSCLQGPFGVQEDASFSQLQLLVMWPLFVPIQINSYSYDISLY